MNENKEVKQPPKESTFSQVGVERIVSWWKTPPDEDDLFFVNIRKLYQSLFCPEIRVERRVKEFITVFPGKCIICSYHRFGIENGLTTEKKPPKHDCIDVS